MYEQKNEKVVIMS